MKFLVLLCLLGVAAADEEKTQEKKTQSVDNNQNQGLTQTTGSLLSNPVFPGTGFPNPISNFAYTGFNPIQTVNPDFFNAASGSHGGIPTFPTVTRTVLPGTAGIQSAFPVQGGGFPVQGGGFPVQGGVFPGVVGGIAPQFQGVGAGLLSAVTGVPGVSNGALDANTAAAHGAYRFLTPEGLSGIGAQGLQTAQNVGFSGIPAFTGGIVPSIANGLFQGQTFPTGILKNPTTGTTSGISNIPGLTTGNTSGPLTNAFRTA